MQVSIVLGSKSDLPVAEKAAKVFSEFGIVHQVRVASAHRSPSHLESVIKEAEEAGAQIHIAMAGLAAALPGVVAAMTTKPVIGVPVGGRVPYDSLLSIVQMPPGIPVACVGVDRGDNAAILALQILALSDSELHAAVEQHRLNAYHKVISDDSALRSERNSNGPLNSGA